MKRIREQLEAGAGFKAAGVSESIGDRGAAACHRRRQRRSKSWCKRWQIGLPKWATAALESETGS